MDIPDNRHTAHHLSSSSSEDESSNASSIAYVLNRLTSSSKSSSFFSTTSLPTCLTMVCRDIMRGRSSGKRLPPPVPGLTRVGGGAITLVLLHTPIGYGLIGSTPMLDNAEVTSRGAELLRCLPLDEHEGPAYTTCKVFKL